MSQLPTYQKELVTWVFIYAKKRLKFGYYYLFVIPSSWLQPSSSSPPPPISVRGQSSTPSHTCVRWLTISFISWQPNSKYYAINVARTNLWRDYPSCLVFAAEVLSSPKSKSKTRTKEEKRQSYTFHFLQEKVQEHKQHVFIGLQEVLMKKW